MAETLIITLSDRRPLKILKEEWPVVSSAMTSDEVLFKHGPPHGPSWKMAVRHCPSRGAYVVYGSYTLFDFEDVVEGHRQGVLVTNADCWEDDVEPAIREVAELLQAPPSIVSELFSKLPVDDRWCSAEKS